MSFISECMDNYWAPNRFGRILIFILGVIFAGIMGIAAYRIRTDDPVRICAFALTGAAMVVLAAMCLKSRWYASRFFASLCVVAFASLMGLAASISAVGAMEEKSFSVLLLIPAALAVFSLPLWFAQNKFFAWLLFLCLGVLFSISWIFILTLTGWWSLAGLGFAFLVMVCPSAAVAVLGCLIMITLAAIGAGAIGSYSTLHK